MSTDCERGVEARVGNQSDELAEVLVRFSDQQTDEVLLEQPLQVDPDAGATATLPNSEGPVAVTVLDLDSGEVLAAGTGQQLRCIRVVEDCDAVEFTNPEENPAVRLETTMRLEEGVSSTTLEPGETLRVEWFDGRWEAVREGAADATAGAGFASVSYDTCPGQVGNLTVTCSAADGADGTLETDLGPVPGAEVTWRLSRQERGTVATGTATGSGDVRARGLAVGGYVLDVLVDGERSDRLALRVATCLTVVTTCSTATFTSAASNPDATIGFFGPLDDPTVRDIDNPNYNVLGIAPGQSVTVDLDGVTHEWRSLQSLASGSDPDSPFRGTVTLGTGPLPAAEECPPVTPEPVDHDAYGSGDGPGDGGTAAGGTGAGMGGAGAGPEHQLAETGGPAGPLLGLGLVALLGGATLLTRRR
ncbi:carboxypeptidase-like regulatory domain-containing protein [Auraticoccus monumenti]|uniref:carboxypeptidase-like regulatory domain-containing protein n=1 Tax=Auraticoccus monumenti TaxID=675864 RepID=UPI0012F82928|nr:carboxypeptidase-like regulatory domain-containing protein [Auraticoccus monumenti]